MRVEIKRDVMISGEPVKAGSFVEIDDQTAYLLIGIDKAVVAPEPEPAPSCPPRPPAKRAKSTTTSKD